MSYENYKNKISFKAVRIGIRIRIGTYTPVYGVFTSADFRF
jgi:hypothetical protein